jgi:hypothetical protein
MKKDLTAICWIRLAFHESGRFQPINQLYGSVMAQCETIRQLADRRMSTGRQAFERQQSLMLVRLNPMFSRPCLTELKKMPKLVAKLS